MRLQKSVQAQITSRAVPAAVPGRTPLASRRSVSSKASVLSSVEGVSIDEEGERILWGAAAASVASTARSPAPYRWRFIDRPMQGPLGAARVHTRTQLRQRIGACASSLHGAAAPRCVWCGPNRPSQLTPCPPLPKGILRWDVLDAAASQVNNIPVLSRYTLRPGQKPATAPGATLPTQ
jgi:hypothetical protein